MVKTLLKLFFCFLVFTCYTVNAQTWLPLGPDDKSTNKVYPGAVKSTNIFTDAAGIPYVICLDANYKYTVRKFVDGTWQNVGTATFAAGTDYYTKLVFIGNTPYFAYADSDNGNKLTVKKFDGKNWTVVGTVGLSAARATSPTLSTDGSTIYVAYGDDGNAGRLAVKKFDGTNWILVGTAGISSGSLFGLIFTINNNIPYVAYLETGNGTKGIVQKFDGGAWVIMGTSNFITPQISFYSLVFYGSTPFIAYTDSNNSYKISVKRFNGSTWSLVGATNFSTGTAAYISIATNGTPYVAYEDGGLGGKATVKKFDGIQWVTVGVEGFSTGPAEYTSIALNDQTPYITFKDNDNGIATVMRFDGSSWLPVGSAGSISAGYSNYLSLAFNNDIPYVGYTDSKFGNRNTVKKFNGTSWTLVGKEGFSTGQTINPILSFNDNIAYISYTDAADANKGTIKKFDGQNWVTVGPGVISTGTAAYLSLKFNGNVPYIAYADFGNGGKVSVKRYDGNSWVLVGVDGISAGTVSNVELGFNGSSPQIAYPDNSNGGKLTVMQFNGTNWVTAGTPNISVSTNGSYVALASHGINFYTAYNDPATNYKLTIKKYDGSNWLTVGSPGFSAGNASYISMAFNNDIPYVSYADGGNAGKITVKKFNGNNWATAGEAGFSSNTVIRTALAINKNSIYTAYEANGAYLRYFTDTPIASTNAQLTDLTLSSGTITPAFTPNQANYTVSVLNSVNSITVNPVASDATTTIKVNNVTVLSNSSSPAIPLNVGSNTITVLATAQDGTTTQSYTIAVNRAQATQTITFASLIAKSYGNTDFLATAVSDNNATSITYSSDNLAVATIVQGKIHITGAGTANITALQAGNTNFIEATPVTQNLVINKTLLNITADNKNKIYGEENPALTVNYNGFVNNETVAVLIALPNVTTSADKNSTTGDYLIAVAGASGNNYNITYLTGILKIVPANQNITFAAVPAKTYGDTDFDLIATSSSGIPVSFTVGNSAVATVSSAGKVHIIGAGTTTITAAQTGDKNYNTAIAVTQNLVVNKASLNITADNKSKVYGTQNPVFTIFYKGFVNKDSESNLTTLPVISSIANLTSNAGNYPITISEATAANYTINYAPGTLTITPANQNITFAAFPAKTYGDTDFTPVASASSGLPITFTSNNTNVVTVINGLLHIVAAGTGTITATQAGNINYAAASSVNQVIQIDFKLPANNFTVSAISESCKNSNNGEINIAAAGNYNYTATISSGATSTTYPFTNRLAVKNLSAGTYPVCITVPDFPAFKQCFEIKITEPKDLSVYSVVNPATGILNLSLGGAGSYNVNLNGTIFTTKQSSISLSLKPGKNTLKVSTASICQGSYERVIESSSEIVAFPNPFENTLSLSVGNHQSKNARAAIYNMQGKQIYSAKNSIYQGICSFDLAGIPAGSYLLKLILDDSEKTIKIIKK